MLMLDRPGAMLDDVIAVRDSFAWRVQVLGERELTSAERAELLSRIDCRRGRWTQVKRVLTEAQQYDA